MTTPVTRIVYRRLDRAGHEVDVVIDAGTRLVPIEVKAGETVSDDLFVFRQN